MTRRAVSPFVVSSAPASSRGSTGQLVILSDDPAVPRVEKTFQPDPGTLDTGQNVVIAGNYRGCRDELMISADTWRNYDYFGRLREDALNSVGMGQLNYGFY